MATYSGVLRPERSMEGAPLTERERALVLRVMGLREDETERLSLKLSFNMYAELTLGITQEVDRETKFLRDLVLSGMPFDKSVEVIEQVRQWAIYRLGSRLCDVLKHRQYHPPSRKELPWQIRQAALSDDVLKSYLDADKNLFLHENMALSRGDSGCHCDLCSRWVDELRRISEIARTRCNTNKRRQRSNRHRGHDA